MPVYLFLHNIIFIRGMQNITNYSSRSLKTGVIKMECSDFPGDVPVSLKQPCFKFKADISNSGN